MGAIATWRARTLRGVFSSGGPLAPEAALAAGDLLGEVPIEVYGSSETGGVANQNHPNRLRDGNLDSSQRSITHWFDTAAFAVPANYTYGSGGRDILYGPTSLNLDFKIGKALARAFARNSIEVSVATTRDPENFASDAAAIGPGIVDVAASTPSSGCSR